MTSAIWRDTILFLAGIPLLYYLLATIVGWRFFSRRGQLQYPDYRPPVSVLKPVRGVDFGSAENFASFCRQDYPDYEILFAVNDADDPAVTLIEKTVAQFPERRIRLLVGAEQLGANRKVNKLVRLAHEAQYDTLVLTDGDVRVGPNFLREVVTPLQDPKVGAVTSFYRAIAEENLYARLEAVGAASDFFPSVLMAQWTEGISFALGASIATTRDWLAKMGGFASLADSLADDYELGNRIAKASGKILLAHETVWTMYPAQTLRGFWDHQVRWARTVRLCRPLSYLGLNFTQGLPWTLLAILVAPTMGIAAIYGLAYLFLRFAMAWTVGVSGIGDEVLRRTFWLIPFRDAIHFVIWLASFGSNRIRWGSAEYTVEQGRMVPVRGNEPVKTP